MDFDVGDMATLREAKAIGAAASTLLLVGFGTNPLNGVALFLGLILLLVAAKYVSQQTSDGVYSNMRWAVVCIIIGLILGFLIVFAGLRSAVNFSSGSVDWATFTGTLIAGLVVVWIFFILAAVFTWRSYSAIAQSLDADLFRTAATLFLLGAAFIIVLGFGFIIIFAAIGVQLAAFLSLPDEKRPKQPIDPWGKPLPSASPSQLPKKQ